MELATSEHTSSETCEPQDHHFIDDCNDNISIKLYLQNIINVNIGTFCSFKCVQEPEICNFLEYVFIGDANIILIFEMRFDSPLDAWSIHKILQDFFFFL